MNAFRPHYNNAKQVFFLAATYGHGHAPEAAAGLLKALRDAPEIPHWSSTVLGFGNRAFAHYCQFAKDIDATLQDRSWPRLMQATFINRGSTQAFASWGTALGTLLGHDLTLMHDVAVPPTRPLILTAKTVYGAELQTPTAVLHFRDAGVQNGSVLPRLDGAWPNGRSRSGASAEHRDSVPDPRR